MAKGATIYKLDLNIADMDRDYYAEHALTLALHPSETEERMMVRLLAFALFAGESLEFGPGLSTRGEPDLLDKDMTGAMRLSILLGHPDEKDLRQAAGRARQVVVMTYAGRGTDNWWAKTRKDLERLPNLTVLKLPADAVDSLGRAAARKLPVQCNIQDGGVSIIAGEELVELEPESLKGDRLAVLESQ